MLINRSDVIKMLHEKTGFYQKDVKTLLKAYDELITELFDEVTDDEEVIVQLVQGIKVGLKIVKPRERVDPRDGTPIVCSETAKPFAKFSDDFRSYIQNQYNNKKFEDG